MRLKSSVAIYKMMIGRESRCIVLIETVHWLKYIVFMGPNWSWHIFLESFPQFSLYWVIGSLLISAVSMNTYVRPSVRKSVNITAPNSETKLCKENHIIYKTSCLLFFPSLLRLIMDSMSLLCDKYRSPPWLSPATWPVPPERLTFH